MTIRDWFWLGWGQGPGASFVLAWGGTRVVGGGGAWGQGSMSFFTAKSFGNTLGQAPGDVSKKTMNRQSSYRRFRLFLAFWDRGQNVAFLTKPNAAADQHPHEAFYAQTQQQHKGGVTPFQRSSNTSFEPGGGRP